MASDGLQYLFKETRLNLEPPTPNAIATIRVPSVSGQSQGRAPRKSTQEPAIEDESTFRWKHLASSSSLFHRKHHDTPRSFLWRILEDGTVLSIRAVDVCQAEGSAGAAADASLILNFHFEVPIQPGCVAFADPAEHDALAMFVLDQGNRLYSFSLRPDQFRSKAAVDAALSDLCKVQVLVGLGFKHAHRLVAVSADVLLITVNDGGMIRLNRVKTDDAPYGKFKEDFFNVQGWAQNLRSLLPFQGKHTVRYGNTNMEYSAATSIQVTDLGLKGALFAVTVCLDHRMRIWNIDNGQILHTGDLLGVDRQPQDIGKWTVDPAQSNLVQLIGRSRGSRICATYSPIGLGEFKFWTIKATDASTIVVEDLFPSDSLVPVTPSSSDVWTLADFVLVSPVENSFNLWTLWKNNMTYRVQRLELDRKHMGRCWAGDWDGVVADKSTITPSTSGPCDHLDVTEKWLQLILQPGRFSKATIETALSIYERGLGVAKDGAKTSGRSLPDLLCSVLGSTCILEHKSTGPADYTQFRSSNEIQWRRFYRLLLELDRQRGEAVSLTWTPGSDMVWVVCADMLSAVRGCSDLEMAYYNISTPIEGAEEQNALIDAAVSFVEGFSDNFIQLSEAALRSELFESSTRTDLERISYFSDQAGFWRGISDDDCSQVVETLGSNFETVTDRTYRDVLGLLSTDERSKTSREGSEPLTLFGRRLGVKVAQEQLQLRWTVAFSQLILLVHMEFEFDHEADALHNRVDIGSVYRRLIKILHRLELLKWLVKTETAVLLSKTGQSDAVPALPKRGGEEPSIVTVLEACFGHELGLSKSHASSMAVSITDLAADLCSPGSGLELSPEAIQCCLLKYGRPDLASELSAFCEPEPFSLYIQGRVALVLADFDTAALHFRKAVVGMSSEDPELEKRSEKLLGTVERDLLHDGAAHYHVHVSMLFEDHDAPTHVIDFSKLALQFLSLKSDSDGLLRSATQTRLFDAALACSHFEAAHSVLQHIKDTTQRQAGLRRLVAKMCKTNQNRELVSMPFPGMQQEVEAMLAKMCQETTDVQASHYHQVLYSWRMRRSNYRGAASVVLDRLQKLALAGEGDRFTGDDALDTPVTRQYLLLINALSCVEPKQAWIFDEGGADSESNGDLPRKRKVVSLADVRKQYQDELDRIAAIQNNQFALDADDVMDTL